MEFYTVKEAKEHLASLGLYLKFTDTERVIVCREEDNGVIATGLFNEDENYVLLPYDDELYTSNLVYEDEKRIWCDLDSHYDAETGAIILF